MKIKQDMSSGFNRKYIIEVDIEELEWLSYALEYGACDVNHSMTQDFRNWCYKYSVKIYKILNN